MVHGNALVGDYTGCSGQIVFPDAPKGIHLQGVSGSGQGTARGGCYALQWLNPAGRGAVLPSPAEDEHVLLSGVLAEPATAELAVRIHTALVNGRYEDMARVAGDLAGCLVTPEKIYLFKSITGNSSTIFFRRSGDTLRWSTDPAELVDDPDAEIDWEAIWHCCRADDPFIYRTVDRVRPGQVVVIERHRMSVVEYDRITPLELPRRTPLPEYAELAYALLLEAVRPYAASGRIGVLLSGGLDSSAVITALADAGADVIAYHLDTDDPLADESDYARAVCEHLDVPFVPIMTDTGAGYLSRRWMFPHPYSHSGYRHLEQAAERVAEDGVTFLTTGRDGDLLFGPLRYGMHDILFGDLRWREKREMLGGMLSSHWELPHIIKSCVSGSALVDDLTQVGAGSQRSDFLNPRSNMDSEEVDFSFMPQEHIMELTLFRPRGIFLCCPLGSKDLRRLSLRLPNAYKRIPFQGRKIDKPVLRMMLASRLPERIWRRPGRSWLDSPHESYVLRHSRALRELIGSPDAYVVRAGMVNPALLANVLDHSLSLRRNTQALICSAMVELFFRSMEKKFGTGWKGLQDAPALAS